MNLSRYIKYKKELIKLNRLKTYYLYSIKITDNTPILSTKIIKDSDKKIATTGSFVICDTSLSDKPIEIKVLNTPIRFMSVVKGHNDSIYYLSDTNNKTKACNDIMSLLEKENLDYSDCIKHTDDLIRKHECELNELEKNRKIFNSAIADNKNLLTFLMKEFK